IMLCSVVLAIFQTHQSVLFTLTQEGCNPLSSLFLALSCEGCTLLHQSEAHLPFFHQLAHSLRKHPAWHQERSRVSASPLSRLQSALRYPGKRARRGGDGRSEEPQSATKGLLPSRLESALKKRRLQLL